jgi:hypothetical protein
MFRGVNVRPASTSEREDISDRYGVVEDLDYVIHATEAAACTNAAPASL